MSRAINMRLKNNTFLLYFPGAGQREHLVATTIRQYRPVPAVKPVKATRLLQYLRAGPEIQVIGIAQNDLGIDVLRQLPLGYRFHTSHRAYRHKDRRKDLPMVGSDPARPRRRPRAYALQFKL